MMRSLYSGITGLQGSQTNMDVIGNNISNVNTVGFKASRVTFESALLQAIRAARSPQKNLGGVNPMSVGLGTQIASIDKIMGQGSFQNTGKKTDLAIQGDGFFIVNSGNNDFYTRAGNFSLDQDGTLIQAGTGYKVMGWEAKVDATGNRHVDVNKPVAPIQISANETMSAKATTAMGISGNLDSTTGIQPVTLTVTADDGSTYTVQFTFKLNKQNFDPFSHNRKYNWTAKVIGASSGSTGATLSGEITLDQYGNVTGDSASNLYINSSSGTVSLATSSSTSTVSGAAISLPSTGTISFTESDNTANAVVANYTNPMYTTSTQIYDSLGKAYTVYVDFTNLGSVGTATPSTTTAWAWDARLADGTSVKFITTSGSQASSDVGVVEFNSSGRMTGNFALTPEGKPSKSGVPTGIKFNTSNGAGVVKSQIDFTQLTDLAGNASAAITSQNGNAKGTLQSFAMNQSGEIIGTFSNGMTDILGKIALANFNNPAGLKAIGNSLYSKSANSGTPQIGPSGTGGRGTFIPGALEMSNVDLAKEFSSMIVAERTFQANARVITTSDAMIQQLVALKQTP